MSLVTFVVAGAGDLELGAGGTCSLLIAKGYDVRVIVLADDENPDISARRRQETLAGAMVLGVKPEHVGFLGLRAGAFASTPESIAALSALVGTARAEPVAVFTHSGATQRSDDIETLRLVRATFSQAAIFTFLARPDAIPTEFVPRVHCIIDGQLAAKERAAGAHVSCEARVPRRRQLAREMTAHFAKDRGGRHCEAFASDGGSVRRDLSDLVRAIDSSPFMQFWSPLLASAKFNVLVGAETARASGSTMSDPVFLARLQSRLVASLAIPGVDPARAFEVHDARGGADTALAEAGHVFVLGGANANPAADQMLDWLNLRPYLRELTVTRKRKHGIGLLTIAASPMSLRRGSRAFILAATGLDQAASMAAAECLIDDAKLLHVLPEAREVFAGRLAVVQIEVVTEHSSSDPGLTASRAGRKRALGRAA